MCTIKISNHNHKCTALSNVDVAAIRIIVEPHIKTYIEDDTKEN